MSGLERVKNLKCSFGVSVCTLQVGHMIRYFVEIEN